MLHYPYVHQHHAHSHNTDIELIVNRDAGEVAEGVHKRVGLGLGFLAHADPDDADPRGWYQATLPLSHHGNAEAEGEDAEHVEDVAEEGFNCDNENSSEDDQKESQQSIQNPADERRLHELVVGANQGLVHGTCRIHV